MSNACMRERCCARPSLWNALCKEKRTDLGRCVSVSPVHREDTIMNTFIVVASLCILGSSMMAAQPASADVRINANVSSGRTVYFDTEPTVVLVPGTQVYYGPYGTSEVFRYHNRWYVSRGDTWYRASSYRGPFYQVDYDRVPRQVVAVPYDYRMQYRSQNHGWYDRHHRYHNNANYDNDNHRHRD